MEAIRNTLKGKAKKAAAKITIIEAAKRRMQPHTVRIRRAGPIKPNKRRWRYLEPGADGQAVECIITEAELRTTYYPWWQKQMRKAGKADQINFDECIKDFIVVHWAWAIDGGGKAKREVIGEA